jgi:hypothetical protein
MMPPMDGAVAGDELGGRVGDDMRAPFKRAEEIRGGKGVVDQQNQFVLPGDLRHFFKREDGNIGIPQRFAVDHFGVRLDRRFKILRVAWVNKCDLDSQLGQGVGELVVCAAVQAGRRNDMVACAAAM